MRKSAKDLLETSDEDMTNLKSQLLDLTTRWDNVNQLNSNKDARLQVCEKRSLREKGDREGTGEKRRKTRKKELE